MTVAFKKDFLAKVAMLQEAISGHHDFEVRNEHSDEKVGEVAAFGGSLVIVMGRPARDGNGLFVTHTNAH